MSEEKDKRVSVLLPDEIAADFEQMAEKMRMSKGGLGALAIEFVVPKIKRGELVNMNGELIPKSKAA